MKKLYVTPRFTPEEGYDPRYYDGVGCDEKLLYELEKINAKFYMAANDCLFTEEYNTQKFLQQEGYDPLWFDTLPSDTAVVEELKNNGYTW